MDLDFAKGMLVQRAAMQRMTADLDTGGYPFVTSFPYVNDCYHRSATLLGDVRGDENPNF